MSSRRQFALVLVAFAGATAARQAQGQVLIYPPEQLTFNPAVLKAEEGAWSEYALRENGGEPDRLRVTLVRRDDEALTYELRSPFGGDRRPQRSLTVQLRLPLKPGAPPVTTAVLQLEGAPPMTVSCDPTRAAFTRPTAKTLVGSPGAESIETPAGRFRTNHHRYTMADFDEPNELWMAAGVLPLGLVKVKNPEGVLGMPIGGRSGGGPLIFAWPAGNEWILTATGTHAKPAITERPRPYDEKELRKVLASGRRRGPP